MKVFNKLFLTGFIVICFSAICFAQADLGLKDYHSVMIPKGSFFKGTLMSDISSEINQLGDRVWLLNSSNMYIGEVNAIPKGSIFEGEVSAIQKAKKGQDGSLQVDLRKIIYPNGKEISIKAALTQKGSTKFGGAITKREGYRKVVHYSEKLKGYVQLIPDGERIMGKGFKLTTGDEYIIQLVDDINIILKDN